jgi:hypothetical protein
VVQNYLILQRPTIKINIYENKSHFSAKNT